MTKRIITGFVLKTVWNFLLGLYHPTLPDNDHLMSLNYPNPHTRIKRTDETELRSKTSTVLLLPVDKKSHCKSVKVDLRNHAAVAYLWHICKQIKDIAVFSSAGEKEGQCYLSCMSWWSCQQSFPVRWFFSRHELDGKIQRKLQTYKCRQICTIILPFFYP